MVEPTNRAAPLRFILGAFGEGLRIQSHGPRTCNSRSCESLIEINSFGPGLSLGLTTTSPGFLFESRLGLAYHWGNRTETQRSSSGVTLREDRDTADPWSVTGHVGFGVNLQAAAFYAFGEFFYAGSSQGENFRSYGFGPGFGFSFGPNRLISFEAAYYPLLTREGYAEDRGYALAVRGMIDFMALVYPRKPPQTSGRLPPSETSLRWVNHVPPPPPLVRPNPQQGAVGIPQVRVDGNIIHYVGLIHFHYNSALIRTDDESYRTIARVAAFLRNNPDILRVEVHGHTDDQGPVGYNDDLSQRRAAAVTRALTDRGIQRERLLPVGHGEHEPIVRDTSDRARALNRRVEFRIVERR